MDDWVTANENTIWASLLIQALTDRGLTTYFVSPGYRNAPMIAALRARQDVDLISCPDERAAGYQALGYSKASETPSILICTSGTAGANYLPAVIEAYKEQVPILVITCDRPFELRYSASNQTINQQGLFHHFVRREFDFPAPSLAIEAPALFNYIDLACRTMAYHPSGPVHINLPFQSPLEPIGDVSQVDHDKKTAYINRAQLLWQRRKQYLSPFQRQALKAEAWQDGCKAALTSAKAPLVLVGRLNKAAEIKALRPWLKGLRVPFYCDVTSSLKACEQDLPDPAQPDFRQALISYRPDLVLHLGRRLVTKHYDQFFKDYPPERFISVSEDEDWQDPAGIGSEHLLMDPSCFLEHMPASLLCLSNEAQLAAKKLYESHNRSQAALPSLNWYEVAKGICRILPADCPIMIGNSNAIRVFDRLEGRRLAGHQIFANRGVSGIEGLLSTSLGLARGLKQALALVIGDISMIHDLNALLAVGSSPSPLLIVVVNDGGGGIFRQLPIAKFPQLTDPFMTTPHSFDFAGIAAMAQIDYLKIDSLEQWQLYCRKPWEARNSCLLEISLPATH